MDDLLIAYERNKEFLENFRGTLVTLFETIILQDRQYHRLQSKLSTPDELTDYLNERNKKGLRELSELKDFPNLIKIRLITYADEDIDYFLGYICNFFELNKVYKSYDYRKHKEPGSGVNKIEYIMQFPFSVMEKFEQYAVYRSYKFQLEIITLLKYSQMVLSGKLNRNPDWIYPKHLRIQFDKFGVFIEQADETFQTLMKDFNDAQSSLLKFQSYSDKYTKEQSIDLASLIEACMGETIINYLDLRISEYSHARYQENFSMLDFYIKKLAALNINKMVQLLNLLFELQKPLLIFTKYHHVNSSASSYLFTGVSLGFLANYLLAEKNDPEFALNLYKKLYSDEINQSLENFESIRKAYLKTRNNLNNSDLFLDK